MVFQQNFKKLPVEYDEVVSLLVVNMLLVVPFQMKTCTCLTKFH